jgi:hypothetical protein
LFEPVYCFQLFDVGACRFVGFGTITIKKFHCRAFIVDPDGDTGVLVLGSGISARA